MDDLTAAVTQAYPCVRSSSIRSVPVPHESCTCHVKLVSDDGAAFSLKERSWYMRAADWVIHLEFQEYLSSLDAPVPRLVRTLDGQLELTWSDRSFRLEHWVEGSHVYRYGARVGHELGRSLAELHGCAKGFRTSQRDLDLRPFSRHRAYPNRKEDWRALLHRFRPPGDAGDSWRGEPTFQRTEQRLEWLLSEIDFAALPRAFIHGDAHLYNVIRNSCGWTWIDLEDARLDIRLVDLVWLALVSGFFDWKSVTQRMEIRTYPRWGFIKEAITGYHEVCGISRMECASLPLLLELYLLAAIDNCLERQEIHASYREFCRVLQALSFAADQIVSHSSMLRSLCQQ